MELQVNFSGFEQQLLLNQVPFIAKIYEGEGEPSEEFNIIRIVLDASEHSLLRWGEAILRAKKSIQKGFLILWELQFSLLEGSLEDEARFLTFHLNIQHFNEIIWIHFRENSLGVALFRGELSLQQKESVVDYLKSLAALLMDDVHCFLFFDTSLVFDPTTYFRLVSQEVFGHFHLFLKGPCAESYPFAVPAFGWGHARSSLGFCSHMLMTHLPQSRVTHALCLPKEIDLKYLHSVIEAFGSIPFRVIHEDVLTHEWDGIDTLIIFPNGQSEKVRRKIRGFIAAGGQIINFPDDATLLQLPEIFPPSSLAFSLQIDQ